jgi:carboxynorspermidine decarboxylase
MIPQTPYYLIDEKKLLNNLKKIKIVQDLSGAKSVLALKCFACWPVFKLMKQYMAGTTGSSINEVKLGTHKFGGETHAYSVGYTDDEIDDFYLWADKVIFNSASQLKRFYKDVRGKSVGIRINPCISYSHFSLADPNIKGSRLGVTDLKELKNCRPLVDGAMFHYNCENSNISNIKTNLHYIADEYEWFLKDLKWVSLGGGIAFTGKDFPLTEYCKMLKNFGDRFNVQVYLEPGEATIAGVGELVTSVIDIVDNDGKIAIVDASVEAHMLDLLIYESQAKVAGIVEEGQPYTIAGRSCLAGDIFGRYEFKKHLKVGDTIRFQDAAGYTMVKKNWFNGLPMPSIAIKKLDGTIEVMKNYSYADFVANQA